MDFISISFAAYLGLSKNVIFGLPAEQDRNAKLNKTDEHVK